MPENDKLLEHLLEGPTDAARLLVYADWLEEQRDERAAYTRLQLTLRQAEPAERPALLSELRRLYPVAHPAWTGRLEQSGAFFANLLEVPEMWWGVGLGARTTDATYQGFAYHRQPPLPVERFDGSLDWLREAPPVGGAGADAEGWQEKLEDLKRRGFFVPSVFQRLMTEPELHKRVPSCTDNYFLPSEQAEEHPLDDGSCFLTFYSDSQSCVLWGVRLGQGQDRYAPVLAGAPDFPDEDEEDEEDEEEPPEGAPYLSFPDLTWSAPTLEAFLYRWWLENTIWYATQWRESLRPLTAEEQAYLDHLERAAGG